VISPSSNLESDFCESEKLNKGTEGKISNQNFMNPMVDGVQLQLQISCNASVIADFSK